MFVEFLANIAQIGLGFLFALAGVAKVTSRKAFAETLADYWFIPKRTIDPISILLPYLELIIGLCLLFGIGTIYALTGSIALLTVFTMIALINTVQKKTDGCGCFGPGLKTQSSWLTVTVRNLLLLVISGGLLLWYSTSGATIFTVHFFISLGIFFAALMFGLPIRNTNIRLQQREPVVERRQFLHQASTLTAGAVGLALSTNVDRSYAQSKESGLVVEHETELPSLTEAIRRSPREMRIPQTLPDGYDLHRVGAFFERNSQEGVIRDVVLHYQRDPDHQFILMFTKKLSSRPSNGEKMIERHSVGPYEARVVSTSSNDHVLVWEEEAWEVSLRGFNITDDELVAVARSMYINS